MGKNLKSTKALLNFDYDQPERVETRGKKKYPPTFERKTKQNTILLKETTDTQLKDLAWRNHMTFNALVCNILDEYCAKNYKPESK